MSSMIELWNTLAARANVTLDADQHQRLASYLDLLLAANTTMNLTRITDRSAAEVQHVGDSLTLLPHLPPGPIAVADVGSGGGVPGIPLAIARPDMKIALIESTRKKAAFLQRAVTELGLENVSVIDQRAEDVGQSRRRETFDVAIARAVGTLDWLAEWCLPLVKVRGKMLAMKGPRAADEIPTAGKAIKLLGGGDAVVHPADLPGAENHVIVAIPKLRKTSYRYPRPATQAKGKCIIDQ
jgi:16S rRNA (guanine527-N7)-methyltransferase